MQKYPAKVGAYEVSHVVDLTVGYDSRAADLKSTIPKQSGQVITFFLANGGVITFRTSGTEPKIKFYFEVREPVAEGEPLSAADTRARARLAAFTAALMTRLGR